MSDPAEKCIHCGARRDAHIPASTGGLDCPPRADGKRLMIVGTGTTAGLWPHDDDRSWERREWVDPEPKDATDVLRLAQERKGDGPDDETRRSWKADDDLAAIKEGDREPPPGWPRRGDR
jgi:hypothetical protein